MKQAILLFLVVFSLSKLHAQVQGIYVHLYTDSLKKGTYNYINIDGKMGDNSWKPLTGKELSFVTNYGKFEGNNLILPENPTVKKVIITVTLKENPKLSKTFNIWIKQIPDPPLSENTPGSSYRTRAKKQ